MDNKFTLPSEALDSQWDSNWAFQPENDAVYGGFTAFNDIELDVESQFVVPSRKSPSPDQATSVPTKPSPASATEAAFRFDMLFILDKIPLSSRICHIERHQLPTWEELEKKIEKEMSSMVKSKVAPGVQLSFLGYTITVNSISPKATTDALDLNAEGWQSIVHEIHRMITERPKRILTTIIRGMYVGTSSVGIRAPAIQDLKSLATGNKRKVL